jgi:hypothetical protein
MSEREWQPGDVALVTLTSGGVGRMLRGVCEWVHVDGRLIHNAYTKSARPLVVIDPDSADDIARLLKILHGGATGDKKWLCNNANDLTRALREYANPKPAEVYEHFTANGHGYVTKQSLCGKVWTTDAATVSAGKCPECVALVEGGWSK